MEKNKLENFYNIYEHLTKMAHDIAESDGGNIIGITKNEDGSLSLHFATWDGYGGIADYMVIPPITQEDLEMYMN